MDVVGAMSVSELLGGSVGDLWKNQRSERRGICGCSPWRGVLGKDCGAMSNARAGDIISTLRPRRGKKKSERWRTREVGLMKPKKTWRFIEVVYVFESDVIVVMSSERRLESC